MPLQIRRGTTAQRLAITPLPGELIHDTTTGQLFVGNGSTVGGATTTGISTEDAQDATAALLTSGTHSGITFAYNDAAARIDATVTVSSTGPFDGDLTGSVFADDSTLLVDGTNGTLVGPIATSGDSIFVNNTVDGNIYIVRNTALTGRFQGMTFAQHHETPDATNLTFYRTRGTSSTPTPVVDGDRLGDIVFLGSTSATTAATVSPPNGAVISAFVEGSILNTTNIPTKFRFATNNGTAFAGRAELSATGIWKIDSLGALSGTTINVVDNNTITLGDVRLSQDGLSTINTNASLFLFANGTGRVEVEAVSFLGSTITSADNSTLIVTGNVIGDLQGSVFADNSTRIIDGTDGRITATSVTIGNTGYLQLPVYADDTARNAAITAPQAGMVIFNTTLTKFQGYTGSAWVDFN
jgi:hypothetical protein